MQPLRHHESGMMLLEVMLATMIFAIAGVSLAVAVDATIDAFLDIRRESHIRLTLQSALAETRAEPLTAGRQELREISTDEVTFLRDVRVLNRLNEKKEAVTGLYEVVIEAEWTERGQKTRRKAQQFIYQGVADGAQVF